MMKKLINKKLKPVQSLDTKIKPLASVAKFRFNAAKKLKQKSISAHAVENLLKPLDYIEFDDGSDVSEIEDVFQHFHTRSFLEAQPKGKRYLSKREADLAIFTEFTVEYKATMDQIRPTKVDDNLLLENPEEIRNMLENPSPSIQFTKIVEEDPIEIKISNQSDSTSEASSESITWHMLQINFDPKKFKITPPGYDAFKQPEPHWLEKIEVPWEVINHATIKCEQWLDTKCK